MRFYSESGQSTVEAAVLLPMLFVVFGLLLQPTVLLYNSCIMNVAAAEGCRLVATSTVDDATTRTYVERRLAAIPNIPAFHDDDGWVVNWSRSSDDVASIIIVNHVRPLPLFGILAGLTNSIDADGSIIQRVETSSTPIPTWVGNLGSGPSAWIGAWK